MLHNTWIRPDMIFIPSGDFYVGPAPSNPSFSTKKQILSAGADGLSFFNSHNLHTLYKNITYSDRNCFHTITSSIFNNSIKILRLNSFSGSSCDSASILFFLSRISKNFKKSLFILKGIFLLATKGAIFPSGILYPFLAKPQHPELLSSTARIASSILSLRIFSNKVRW